ncbi:MAG: hypothetical protein C0514_06260 [Candidatus Puniceispirillum sp.]|nr:hypothetical protein [Candidatus Puniceispirillum sp.]
MKHAILSAAAAFFVAQAQSVQATAEGDGPFAGELNGQPSLVRAYVPYGPATNTRWGMLCSELSTQLWSGGSFERTLSSSYALQKAVRAHAAALTQEEIDCIYGDANPYKTLRRAEKRYADAHHIPRGVMVNFSLSMTENGDQRRALLACLGHSISYRFEPGNDLLSYDTDALAEFLNALEHIGRDGVFNFQGLPRIILEKRTYIYSKVKEGLTLDAAEAFLFKQTMGCAQEAALPKQAEELASRLPRSVRLRASLLPQDLPLKMEILQWVAGQEEERALATLAVLVNAKSEENTRSLMRIISPVSTSFLKLISKSWARFSPSVDLMGALQSGVVTHREFKAMVEACKPPAAGRSVLVETTLLTRLLTHANA